METEKNNLNIFWTLLIIVILFGGIYLFFTFEPKKEEQNLINKTITYYDVNIFAYSNNSKISANYILYNNYSGIEQKGFILNNAITQYTKAKENDTFVLEAWDDDNIEPDYYKSKISCFVNKTDEECKINLEREGSPKISSIVIDTNNVKVWLHNPYGVVKNPLICFGYEKIKYLNVINKNKETPPYELQDGYNFCIKENTINSTTNLFYDLKYEGSGKIKIIIRDLCENYNTNVCGIPDIEYTKII